MAIVVPDNGRLLTVIMNRGSLTPTKNKEREWQQCENEGTAGLGEEPSLHRQPCEGMGVRYRRIRDRMDGRPLDSRRPILGARPPKGSESPLRSSGTEPSTRPHGWGLAPRAARGWQLARVGHCQR